MSVAYFRFDAGLSRFLVPDRRERTFALACARAANLKNAIESVGVPHVEVAAVSVGGQPATLSRTVRDGDSVEVRGWGASGTTALGAGAAFVADAHLGALARFLRMMGFDTVYDVSIGDEEIRRLAEVERRIVLSRDRELLKCREIARGCYVRATDPAAQLREVAGRYDIVSAVRPFTLCLRCNLVLAPASAQALGERVPPAVLATHADFTECLSCRRVYWPGSHYRRMCEALAAALDAPRTGK